MPHSDSNFVFFGGEPLGVPALEALAAAHYVPSLIVCNPDKPVGRKQVMTSPPVKKWAKERDIPVLQPTSYQDMAALTPITASDWDVFVVVAYNHILPQWLIELPTHGTLNLHPSLLPQYRGASPIRTAILENNPSAVGVSIIKLDAEMDHGPIIAQEPAPLTEEVWPISGPALDALLGEQGGRLLAQTLPAWIHDQIIPHDQAHDQATYCGKLTKSMGELAIDPHQLPTGTQAQQALLKIRALAGWPGTFFIHQNTRVKILAAHIADNTLVIERVVPAGKAAMDFVSYLQSVSK